VPLDGWATPIERPGWAAIARLRAWLAEAELPDPPLALMPGVEAHDVERLRAQLLAETALGDSAAAVPNLRYLAARDRGAGAAREPAAAAAPSAGLTAPGLARGPGAAGQSDGATGTACPHLLLVYSRA
jgi:hypothetical protein